jgi:hypothetical protein
LDPRAGSLREGALDDMTEQVRLAAFLTDLHVAELRDGRHQLLAPLVFYSAELRGTFIVPTGTITDYASSPRLFRAIVPPDGPWKWAAVLHDAASQGELLTPDGARVHLVKHLTDPLFREAMSVPPCDSVNVAKRWLMYRLVRRFGRGAYGGPGTTV